MRHQIAFLSLFLLISGFTHRQTSTDKTLARRTSPDVEAQVKQTIRERLDAVRRRDAKAYLSYFAEDCVVTNDNGSLIKPQAIAKEWTDSAQYGISYKGSDPLEVQVTDYGDIAVASFRLDLDEDWAGQKIYGTSRFTDVFAKRGGRWLLVAHQETPVPNARRIAAKVDAVILDSYVGEYQITPNYVIKVKREDGKLMELWPGDASYGEDLAITESTFVSRGEPGFTIYEKDQAGKTSRFIFRTPSGDLVARKIK